MRRSMQVHKKIEELVKKASFELGADVVALLRRAYSYETNARAKRALGQILDNALMAKKNKIALCQDTGLPVVFVEIGKGIKITASDIAIIEQAIAKGYAENNLRASAVDPLKRAGSFYGSGAIHVDFNNALKGIQISFLPKGFGSENKSALKMFNPTAAIDTIEGFIVESVKKAGPEACPPFIVGVGIGSTSDGCLLLAKKALVGNLCAKNPDNMLAGMEARLLKKINALHIGPMGFGGKTTALAVKMLKSPTHIAGLPVGINISCHALRRATTSVTFPSLK